MSLTRAQLASAIDAAHDKLHEAIEYKRDECPRLEADAIAEAHDALHAGGGGSPRVACCTSDPEVQATAQEFVALSRRELPCGHTLADIFWSPGTVAKCGQCILDLRGQR